MNSVRIFAPATVANVACAFDILGFAISSAGDTLTLKKIPQRGVVIRNKSASQYGELPTDPKKNTAGVSAEAVLLRLEADFGVEITIEKGVPPGGGLGSSAASAAGAAFGVNFLCGSSLSNEELIQYAMLGERAACGAAHADNVSPALLGGFALIRNYDPMDIVKIPYPDALAVALVYPHIQVRTEDARRVLRSQIPMKIAIQQFGNLAGLIAGLCLKDTALMSRSLEDVIVEPERAFLIPGFHEVKESAYRAGCLGCSISGSGPTVFALCHSLEHAQEVTKEMQSSFTKQKIPSTSYTSMINPNGCIVMN